MNSLNSEGIIALARFRIFGRLSAIIFLFVTLCLADVIQGMVRTFLHGALKGRSHNEIVYSFFMKAVGATPEAIGTCSFFFALILGLVALFYYYTAKQIFEHEGAYIIHRCVAAPGGTTVFFACTEQKILLCDFVYLYSPAGVKVGAGGPVSIENGKGAVYFPQTLDTPQYGWIVSCKQR